VKSVEVVFLSHLRANHELLLEGGVGGGGGHGGPCLS
jgi:hypothetical protein